MAINNQPMGDLFELSNPQPEEKTIETSLTITGKVYDLSTSGLGIGLKVCACIVTEVDSVETINIIGSDISKVDGSYFIMLNSSDLEDFVLPYDIEIYVFQGDKQLDLEKEEIIPITNTNQSIPKHISVFSLPSVKGKLKRKNDVPAAGCLVELYDASDNTKLGNATTNINGWYEIPYGESAAKGKTKRSKVKLKYYNNEDITRGSETNTTLPDDHFTLSNAEVFVDEVVASEPYVGDIIFDDSSDAIYIVDSFTEGSGDWTITKRLFAINEDESETDKIYWKILLGTDGTTYYKVLDKKISYDDSKQFRTVYTWEPNAGEGQVDETVAFNYKKVVETYRVSSSPIFVTSKRYENINFKFTRDTLDLYTRLTTREVELIPKTVTDPDSPVPVRSKKRSYNVEDSPYVASVTGAKVKDVQILGTARDFNNTLRLDHEAVLFGLFRQGVKPTIASFFSISNSALINKIIDASEKNIIPAIQNAEVITDSLKDKIVQFISKKFDYLFQNITDTTIVAITNDITKKAEFVSCLVDYGYDSKNIDNDFWTKLTLSANEEDKLKLAIQYSDLCHSNDAFINEFVDSGTSSLKPLNELLQLTKQEITDKINNSVNKNDILSSTYLPDDLQTAEAFGEYIDKKIETLYPTRSLMLRLANMTDIAADPDVINDRFNTFKDNLATVAGNSTSHFYDIGLTNSIELNIEKDLVRDYIEDNEAIFTTPFSISGFDKNDWIDIFAIVQRLYSLTKDDKFTTVATLIQNGFLSAFDIIKKGKNPFYNKIGASLSTANKRFVYNAAEVKVNKALAILNKYSGASNSGMPGVISTNSIDNSTTPDKVKLLTIPQLETLFGDQDVTDTKHCESVLGPAAYLVDILNLLRQFKVNETETLYDKLIIRRPDIERIPLNCNNAITPLPIIDLVIEILESSVAPQSPDFIWETKSDAETLKADPDNYNYTAYDTIKAKGITSWQRAAFDLKNEELKLYTKAMGINRALLAKPFYKDTANCANPYYDILGLNKVDFDYTGALIPSTLDFDSISDANGRIMVKDVLNLWEISLQEFESLLTSYYINPVTGQDENGNNLKVILHYEGKIELKSAYIEQATKALATEFVKRMYLFSRLLKATQWSISVLDSVIFANLNASDPFYDVAGISTNPFIDKNCVEYIGKVKLFQEQYSSTENQLAGLFGSLHILEYADEKSYFHNTFVNNNLVEEYKQGLTAIVNGDTANDYYANVTAIMEDGSIHPFIQYLAIAMQLSTEEMSTLLYFADLDTDNKLTNVQEAITNLLRAGQLYKVFNIKVDELIAIATLLDTTSVDVDQYIDIQRFIVSHNLDIYTLLYFLNHTFIGDNGNNLPKDEDFDLIAGNITNKGTELATTNDSSVEDIASLTAFVTEEIGNVGSFGEDIMAAFTNTLVDEVKSGTTKETLATNLSKNYKAYTLCEQLTISITDIEKFKALNSANKPLDIFSLPTVATTTSSWAAFKKFVAISDASQFMLPDDSAFDFYKAIATKTITDVHAEIDTVPDNPHYISWKDLIAVWKHNDRLDPNDSTRYNPDLTWFNELAGVVQFFNSFDLNATNTINWVKWDNISDQDIIDIKKDAKDKLGTANYSDRVIKERNKLRIKQRDVLVQYILEVEMEKPEGSRVIKDANDLYSYYLIDTQMTPAVSTSRILQATLAVQLFLQRIQFNLEPGVTIEKEDEEHWNWMSLYRVWEANRKIFLYPENWLEPELRDDKTPFFKELEKDLISNDINSETVENAFGNYISKLEDIANIEYCQMFNQEVNTYSLLHVIGRSRTEHKDYYYRKLVNESYWTSWEKMEVEINSEHLIPVVIKDRLMVFWLEFTDEAEEPSDEELGSTVVSDGDEQGVAPTKAKKVLKIDLCWSEYSNKKWATKRTVEEPLKISNATSESKMNFRFVFEDGDIDKLHVLSSEFESYETIIKYGSTYEVECNNNVQVTKVASFGGNAYEIPDGMKVFGQRLKIESDSGNTGTITLPIASNDGTSNDKEIVENNYIINSTVLCPNQYQDFVCQSPFIVENNQKTVVFVPIIEPDKSSNLLNKAAQAATEVESDVNSIDLPVDKNLPDYFTDEHENLSIINETPDGNPVLYENSSNNNTNKDIIKYKSRLNAFLGYHPFVGNIKSALQKDGIDGVLNPQTTSSEEDTGDLKIYEELLTQQGNNQLLSSFLLNNELVENVELDSNDPLVKLDYIAEKFEFNLKSAYGMYNWEVFFHIPYLVANHFFIEGNYDEALKWMHYIFDPRVAEGESPSRYWKFKPFADYHATDGIDDLMFDLGMNGKQPQDNELNDQIEAWSNDPFKPHNIARIRLSAYMKAVVMKYLDILVARGDESFRIDTMESINEALQYYIIGAQILGKKPEVLQTSILEPKVYADFNGDGMGNAIEHFEEAVIKPENAAYIEKFVESNEIDMATNPASKDRRRKNIVANLYNSLHQTENVYKLYFGIPKNDKMMGYWDLVADRLFKIRNSLNIEGIKRTVDLFAPPIDPGLLAAAAAGGGDFNAAIFGGNANETQYRFTTLLQLALDISNELKSLGGALLSAWEKHDSEELSKLRASQEIIISDMITMLKDKSIEEAQANIENLEKVIESTTFRRDHFQNLERKSKKEKQQLAFMDAAMTIQTAAQIIQTTSIIPAIIGNIEFGGAGFGASPYFTAQVGGEKIAASLNNSVAALNILSSLSSQLSSRAGIVAGQERRQEEWDFQKDMADKELVTLEKQKLSAEIRKAIAEEDKKVHLKQIAHSEESYELLASKFSNQDLYLWMAGEISSLYRSAYDMAYKLAKQAEAAYKFELLPDNFASFITNDYFNANYKGLLAGERLFQQLKKMEADYLANNKRKYELTKHVSLALLSPEQIITLRSTGSCTINLPELLFDMDHPGHYKRRVKNIAITIPCVAGPYTSISASLSLGSNSIRIDKSTGSGYVQTESDTRFMYDVGKGTTIAVSSAINDSGMFELNFNDARYLPFEGAGAISEWFLTLPGKTHQFDYNTISDVILHIQYTAEEGGLRTSAEDYVNSTLVSIAQNNELNVMCSLKGQFPDAWANIENADAEITIDKSVLPYHWRNLYNGANPVDLYGYAVKMYYISNGLVEDKSTSIQLFSNKKIGDGFTQMIQKLGSSETKPDDIILIFALSTSTPTIVQKSLTMAVTGNGSVSPGVGANSYPVGSHVTITATESDSDYEFNHWMIGSNQVNEAETVVDLDDNITATAFFTIKQKQLTVIVTGNGTVDPTAGSHTYDIGTNVNLTATESDADYAFSHWEIDSNTIDTLTTSVVLDDNKTITAVFVEKSNALILTVIGSGSTTPVEGSHEFNADETVALQAIASDDNFYFNHWDKGGSIDANNPSSIVLDTDKSVSAVFQEYLQNLLGAAPAQINGNWYLPDSTGNANNVQIKNTQVAKSDGASVWIDTGKYLKGGEAIHIEHISEDVDIANGEIDSIFWCGGVGDLHKGCSFRILPVTDQVYFNFFFGEGISRINSGFYITSDWIDNGKNEIIIDWDGTTGGTLIVNINGTEYTNTNTKSWEGDSMYTVSLLAYRHMNYFSNCIHYFDKLVSGSLTFTYYYQEGQGTTIYDQSGNGNHGTVNTSDLDDFWGTKSDHAYPALLDKGYSKYLLCESSGTIAHLASPTQSNLGSELITNGSFETDTDWTKDTDVSISEGVAVLSTVSANINALTQPDVVELGKEYYCEIKVSNYSEGGIYLLRPTDLGSGTAITKNGVFRFLFTANDSTALIIRAFGVSTSLNIDYISVKEVQSISAFGTWEFTFNKANSDNLLVYFADGYGVFIDSAERILFKRGVADRFATANGYISPGVDYNIRVIYTKPYNASVYIKGGNFSDWTLVEVASGANPDSDGLAPQTTKFVKVTSTSGSIISNIKNNGERFDIDYFIEDTVTFYKPKVIGIDHIQDAKDNVLEIPPMVQYPVYENSDQVQVATFDGVDNFILTDIKQKGGEVYKETFEIKFDDFTVSHYLHHNGGLADTQKGFGYRFVVISNVQYMQLFISEGITRYSVLVDINHSVRLNQFHTITAEWSGVAGEPFIFTIDGNSYQTTQTKDWVGDSYSPIRYGRYLNNYPLKGQIASIKRESPTTPLIFYFQEGQGSTIYDQSGNGNHGILTGINVSNFWGIKLKEVYPAIVEKGHSKYMVCETAGTTAHLASPDQSNLGSELVTNGNFAADGNWTKGANCVIEKGILKFSNVAEFNTQSVCVNDGYYYVEVVAKGSGELRIYTGANSFVNIDLIDNGEFNKYTLLNKKGDNTIFYLHNTNATVIEVDSVSAKEVQTIPAYGKWEFSFEKPEGSNFKMNFISDTNDTSFNGYQFLVSATEYVQCLKLINGAPQDSLFLTSTGYIQADTRYWIKIKRDTDGTFSFYIKGGSFGNDYVLIDPAGGSGSNPATETTYTVSKFLVIDADANDEISHISKDGVKYQIDNFIDGTGSYQKPKVIGATETTDAKGNILEFPPVISNSMLKNPDGVQVATFDGVASVVSAGKSLLAGKDSFTLEVIFNTGSDINTLQVLAGELYLTNSAYISITGGNIHFEVRGNEIKVFETSVTVNKRYKAKLVYDGTNMYSYLDDVLLDTAAITGNLIDGTAYFAAGAALKTVGDVNYLFKHTIESVYLRTKTDELSWYFQEGQGSIVYDQSGSGNHGSVRGANLDNFWGTQSKDAEPTLVQKGYTHYLINETAGTSAHLASPDQSNLGNELVINNNFSQGNSNWILGTGITITNEQLIINTKSNEKAIATEFNYKLDNFYEITVDVEGKSNETLQIESGGFGVIVLNKGLNKFVVKSTFNGVSHFRLSGVFGYGVKAIIDNISVKEVQSIPAYGEWEFSMYRVGSLKFNFISQLAQDLNFEGYRLIAESNGQIIIDRYSSSGFTGRIFSTATGYLDVRTYYSIKVVRTASAGFTIYVKGGSFGVDYVLVDTTGGSGTNPVLDNTYTETKFMVIDADVQDEISNIIKDGEMYSAENFVDGAGSYLKPKVIGVDGAIDAKGGTLVIAPAGGFSNTGNTLVWPNVQALKDKLPAALFETSGASFEDLQDIENSSEVEVIKEKDRIIKLKVK